MELGLAGLASGFDWYALVDQLTEVERAPQQRMRTEQTLLNQRNAAYASIAAQLTTLKARADTLQQASLFDSRSARVGDAAILNATAKAGSALGSYTFNVSRLASASVLQGTANVGAALNPDNDVSGLGLAQAGFATAVTAGAFTVNGQRVSLETSDTLQGVFDKISAATGGQVTGSYDSVTDKITLSGAGALVLGSATDTSNFLAVAKLNNNGTGTIASSHAVGAVNLSAPLATAHLGTAISDGGGGAGEFTINGVSITFNAATDTAGDVLARINNSAAVVTASYDATQDRFLLTNQKTGDLGVALADVTGNFLAATGLASGTLARGNNLLYSVNGGSEMVSQSNTITAESSGLPGLSVSVLTTGSTAVEIGTDTGAIKSAITGFISEYNKAQSLLDTYTASTTDAKGKVTAGVLAGQSEGFELSSRLRSVINAVVSGVSGTADQLADLGITSNGNDDTLAVSDSARLDEMLANHLSDVRSLFANTTSGLGTNLTAWLDSLVGDDGSLIARQATLSKQITDIDTHVSDQERWVQASRQQMINSFLAMERAQAQVNQQMQFLAQRFGTGG